MDFKELSWLRANAHKFDRDLRGRIIAQQRSITKFPCIFQGLYRRMFYRFRRIPVIIQLTPMKNEEDKAKISNMLMQHGKGVRQLPLINGFSTRLSINELKEIAGQSSIAKIYLDKEVRALLDNAVPSVKADQVWQEAYTGEGITIAILDTGVHQHPDFFQPRNRILAFKDFVKQKTEPYDDNGHGTHCAGAALGNGWASGGKYKGPAYDANLVAVKVLNKAGAGSSSTIIEALDWCLANQSRYGIRILSLSLGYKASDSYRDDPVCQAVEKVVQSGIAVFAAAGNDGPEANTINSPGIHPAVITVGASDDLNTPGTDDDKAAQFSSRGPTIDGLTKPDLLAPGSGIIAAKAKNSLLSKGAKDDANQEWYLSLSGTSMATPICAGIGAQLLEAYPDLTPEELKERLKAGAAKISTLDANTQGSGLVNAMAALKGLQPAPTESEPQEKNLCDKKSLDILSRLRL